MSSLMKLSIILVALAFKTANGDVSPVCVANPGPYYGPKLPELPTAFHTVVQANILNRNYSMLMTEFYDLSSNRGAVRVQSGGKSHYSIYNYNYNEMIALNEQTRNCSVQDISKMAHGFVIFGKNSSNIGTVADLFRFGAQYNETYKGEKIVRGIRCFHWQTCINHQNSSYVLDYYFSIPEWGMANNHTMQVVRATVQGTSTNHRPSPSHPGNNTHNFSHVYDFFLFTPGKPKEESFQMPRGVFCPRMKDRKPLPKFSSVFSMDMEMLDIANKSASYIKEYYDIQRKLVMYQYNDYRHLAGKPVRSVHDFNHGLMFLMSGYDCMSVKLMTMNNTWEATTMADHHHLRMKTSLEQFYSKNLSEAIYTGSSNIRGIETDVWVIKKLSYYGGKSTMEYFFSKPSWNMHSGRHQMQAPVRMNSLHTNKNGTVRQYVFNFMRYNFDAPDLSVFSIGACFGRKKFLEIKLKVNWMEYIVGQQGEFNIGVLKSLANAANVTAIRIDELRSYNESMKDVVIRFALLDKPSGSMFPPGFEPLVHEKDLESAIEALKKQILDGNLVLQWHDRKRGKTQSFKAEKYLHIGGEVSPTKPPGPKPPGPARRKKGVPPGAVAGVAIVMLAVGVCGGLGIAHVIMKRRGTSLFNYQRQE